MSRPRRRGPYIDICIGGAVVRLLEFDRPDLPPGILYVTTMHTSRGNNTYRYSFTESALRAIRDQLEAWQAIGAKTPLGTTRAVRSFLHRANREIERIQCQR